MNYDHAINIITNWGMAQQSYTNSAGHREWKTPTYSKPDVYRLEVLNDPTRFRLAPTKKFVPMTRDDLPAGPLWLRFDNGESTWYQVDSVSVDGINPHAIATFKWQALYENPNVQYSTDRKTWHPFRKEVEG